MFSKKVIVKKYYTLEVPHIKIFKFIDNIYQYNDYGLRLECCPVYDPQEEVNVVNIYTISSDVIRSEYKEDIYTSGDIVNFQNFGNALVIWRNAYDHCYIKTLDMEKIIHRVNGVYVEFNGVNISKHSSLLVTYKNNTRIVGGREGVICHICIKKYESCYTYSTNIKSRSNIFHVCNACRAKIINSHICDSMQMALEEMYRIHINKQIPMKDTIEYISINNKKYRDNKSKFPDFFRELDCHEINEIHIIMKKEHIDFGFAYNVYTKRYSLDEAKRRQYLKNRQQSGKSMDMFDVAKRRSGSYH